MKKILTYLQLLVLSFIVSLLFCMLLNPIDSWGYYGHSVEGRNALLTHLLRMLSGAAHLSFPLTFVLAVAGAVIDHRKQRELDDCAVVGRSNSVQSIATCDDSVSSSEEMPLMIHLVIALWVLMRPILVVAGLAYAFYAIYYVAIIRG